MLNSEITVVSRTAASRISSCADITFFQVVWRWISDRSRQSIGAEPPPLRLNCADCLSLALAPPLKTAVTDLPDYLSAVAPCFLPAMPASTDILAYPTDRRCAPLNPLIPAAFGRALCTVFFHHNAALANIHLPANIAVLVYAIRLALCVFGIFSFCGSAASAIRLMLSTTMTAIITATPQVYTANCLRKTESCLAGRALSAEQL